MALGITGTLTLFMALVTGNAWAGTLIGVAIVLISAAGLRAFQIPLTKYSSLSLIGVAATGGALVIGAPGGAVALYLGVLLIDWLYHQKPAAAAWINASRETLSLVSAYGLYSFVAVSTDAAATMSADALVSAIVLIFSYFYTSIIFNSVDLAENLKKQGAFIPGVKPGASTADYIDSVLALVTLPGGLFLAVVALVPVLVSKWVGVQARFGGTSVLIVVGVLLDTIAQVEQHRTLRKYDGFMKTGRVKFRGRQQRYM
jgi:hypothetical protein